MPLLKTYVAINERERERVNSSRKISGLKQVIIITILFFIAALSSVTFPSLEVKADVSVPAPVFYLPFKSDISDASGNNYTVTNNGTTVVTDSVKGHALYLSSDNQSLTVNAASPTSFTRTAWVKLDTLATAGYGFNVLTTEGGSGSYFWVSNSQFNAGAPATWTLRAGHFGGSGGPTYVYDNQVFPLNIWVHVALTFDNATKRYSLYENGSLVSSTIASDAPSASSNFTVGNFGGTNGWIGWLSGVGLWNSALSSDQIAAIYSGNVGLGTPVDLDIPAVPVTLPVPVFYMPFSGSISDTSGNAHSVVNNGGDSIVTDTDRGQVLSQTTNTQSLTVNAPLPTSFTKSAWVKLSTYTTAGYGFNVISNESGQFFWVEKYSTPANALSSGHFGGSSGPDYVLDSNTFPLDTWKHVLLTFDATTKRYSLYENAILVSSSIAADAPPASSNTTVGNFGGVSGWIGNSDNVGMWNQVFSLDQIKANYNGTSGLENPTAPDSPTSLWPSASTGSVNLSWTAPVLSGGSPLTDYLVEYKVSSDSSWLTFTHSASTSTVATINGLTDNTKYDFRVSALNTIGTSTPSSIMSAIPGVPVYYYILSTGQSLSTGYGSSPPLSTSQPYRNLMFYPGVEGTTTPLIPLVESGQGENGSVETPSSGMADALSMYTVPSRPYIVGLHGHNGTAYSSLAKGTSYYTRGITQVTNARNYIQSLASTFIPVGVTVIHGEDDYNNGNASNYEGYLRQWQSDYQTDVNAITGSTATLPLFTDQMNTGLTGELAVAELSAHKDNPGKIILIGPKYQYQYSSGHLHLTNTDSKHEGEMFAKVMNKVVFLGQTWNPLMPELVAKSGNIITISYNIPVGSLAIDTTNVAARTNYGFEFTQTGGNSVSISSVQLVNNNTQVQITLNVTPTGTNQRVRYAWSCPCSYGGYPNCGGASDSTRVGGNIRDTDTSVSPAINGTGLPLYDWGVTFDEPVLNITQPTVATHAATGVSTSTATFNGSIDATGGQDASQSGFAYSADSTLVSGVSTSTLGAKTSTTTFSQSLSNLTPNTVYYFRAYAVNSAGTSTGIILTATTTDVTPPTVSLNIPLGGSTVAGSAVSLSATATDDVGVTGVQFMLDGTTSIGSLVTSTSSPNTYITTWNSKTSTSASHTLQAVARDAAGNYATSSVTITVDNTVPVVPVVTTSISSGGGSASSQVSNLLAMGQYDLAQKIAKQYGLTIPTQNIPANVVSKSTQSFTRTLKLGMTGSDVKQLQIFLNAQGFIIAKNGAGSPGHETTTFGSATKAALIKFQLAHRKDILDPQGLKSPTGLFATGSMKVANSLLK